MDKQFGWLKLSDHAVSAVETERLLEQVHVEVLNPKYKWQTAGDSASYGAAAKVR